MQRYLRIYEYYKSLIEEGNLAPESKIPSIRKGAIQFEVSRTTMESAYMLLAAEGYISSKPQSGYYVTDMAKKKREHKIEMNQNKKLRPDVRFDFVTANVDKESFKFELWRRYMKSALRQSEKLLSYGEPQGEKEFRQVLADYLRENRGVVCSPEQIVVGAGVQSLLHILCPMIKERKNVMFHDPNFVQGTAVFEDYGFTFVGTDIEDGIYYVSPSRAGKRNEILSTGERLKMIKNFSGKNCLIIEDDYNSEFSYSQKVIPSIQGLAGGHGVVYLGTFSKMLLPSIRMSFMVLPPELLESYLKRREFYNQTASKAEQIALTQFIRDGHLMSQIRKSRKIHMAKSEKLYEVVEQVLGKQADVEIEASGFRVCVKLKTERFAEDIEACAKEKGILVRAFAASSQEVELILASTNVAVEEYEEAVELLASCLHGAGKDSLDLF